MTNTADLRAAAEAATPGPWSSDGEVIGWLSGKAPAVAVQWHDGPTGNPVCMVQPYGSGPYGVAGSLRPIEDAAYIALASPDRILGILSELERKTAALEQLSVLQPNKLAYLRTHRFVMDKVGPLPPDASELD